MNGSESTAVHLPKSSIWPAVLGRRLTLVLIGVVSSTVFTAVGAILLLWSLAGRMGIRVMSQLDTRGASPTSSGGR